MSDFALSRRVKLTMAIAVLGAALMLALPTAAYAKTSKTWYVSATGNDSTGNGTSGNPYATVQTAVDTATTGDVVSVGPGTFSGGITMKDGVSLQGAGANETNLTGTGDAIVTASGIGASTVISGFTVSGNSGGDGIYCSGSSPTITNDTISGNLYGIYCYSSSPTITNGTISGNSDGIGCFSSSSPAITNDTISGNSNCGIYASSSSPTITNDTVNGNWNVGIYSDSSSPAIANCIVWANLHGELVGCSATYSDFSGGSGTGDISADPSFVDAAAGNLHLNADSPCIGEATSTGAPATDKDGVPRPEGAVDMGAYQYVALTPVTVTVTASDKDYDGTDAASVVVTTTDFNPGDDVQIDYSSATFNDQNVGTGKTVTVSGISLGGGDADKYTLVDTQATAAATITPAPLTITADDRFKIYGDVFTFPGTGFSVSGMVGTESIASVTLASAGATADADAATYTIVPSAAVAGPGTDLDNYGITYVSGTLTVGTRVLTITADDQSKTYGDTFTFTGTEFTTGGGDYRSGLATTSRPLESGGLVNGDTIASVTLASDGATATADVGHSPYTITVGDAVAGPHTDLDNYDISYASGQFTVGPKALTVTADDRFKVYGEALTLGSTGFTYGSMVGTESIASVTLASAGATATANAATYTIVPSAAVAGPGTDLDDYGITYVSGTLTVYVRPLTITADDQLKTYGDTFTFAGTEFTTGGGRFTSVFAPSSFPLEGGGLVNGDTIASVTLASDGATATADVGHSPYAITVGDAAAGPDTDLDNYDISYVPGQFTVNTRQLTITANDQLKTSGTTFTFAGTEFTTSDLVGSDAVDSVTLSSAGATSGAAAGSYDIVPASATGTGLTNYAIGYVNGEMDVVAAQPGGGGSGRYTVTGDTDATLTVGDLPDGVHVGIDGQNITVTYDPGFSGDATIPVTVHDDGQTTIVYVLSVVSPAPPAGVVYGPATILSTFVDWTDSANATGYAVYLNGHLVGTTGPDAMTFTLLGLYGPSADIAVQSLGSDGTTSTEVRGTYVPKAAVVIGTVRFGPNSAALSATAKATLHRLAALVKTQGFKTLTIYGWTAKGHSGSAAVRKRLSARRAAAVKAYLLARFKILKIKSPKITVVGKGAAGPTIAAKFRIAQVVLR